MSNTYSITAELTSAQSDGVTTTAGGATIVVGGAAPNKHALLRFDTSTIPSTDYPMVAHLLVKKSANGAGTAPDLLVWASSFGTAIDNADYGLSASNVSPIRVQISSLASPILKGIDAVNTVGDEQLPTLFVNQGTNAYSDFELRPAVATTGATDTVTVYGSSTANTADKPTLTCFTYSEAEYLADQIYRREAVGAESFFAFGRESVEGVPVKATTILDADSIGLIQTVSNLTGQALSNQRARPLKVAVGAAAAGGSVTFDLTPEKCMQLLAGVLKLTSTVTNGDGTYTHTFKVAQSNELASFTAVVKKGQFYYCVYPGCKISRLTISVGVGNIVKASADLVALNEYRYDYTSAGLNQEFLMSTTAGYDSISNGVWSFVDASVAVSGSTDDCVQDFSIEFINDLRARRGLNGKREPKSHYPLGFGVLASFTAYFTSDVRLRKFFGAQGHGYPFKPGKKILFDTVAMSLSRDDIKDTLTITIPKAMFETVSDPINSEDAIMLNFQAVGVYDDTVKSNVTFVLTTNEPATAFQPATDSITVIPADKQI